MVQGRLEQIFKVRRGEWGLLMAFFTLIAMNTAALELADVVATADYLDRVGIYGLPLLWIVDMIVILVSSLAYSLIADRFNRIALLRGLMAGFGMTLLLIRLLMAYGAPDLLTYTLLYVLVDQQIILFPLAFWALASDMYNVNTSKRLFPLVAAGGLIGNVVGNWFAALSASSFALRGISNSDLLIACSLIFFTGVGFLPLAFRRIQVAQQPQSEEKLNLRETWSVGMDFVRNVPLFFYLALLLFFAEIVITIVEYHFLAASTQHYNDPAEFQAFYGSLKAILTIAALVLQLFISGRLLERVGLKNIFLPLPLWLLLGSGVAIVYNGFVSAVIVRFGARVLLNAIEAPARKSIHGLIPDARRGRVSTFLDSYIYATGTIIGSLLLGLLFVLTDSGLLPLIQGVIIYQALAAALAVITLFCAYRLRLVYDTSLINWRLTRRKRRGSAVQLDL